jgi:hypothetical protein
MASGNRKHGAWAAGALVVLFVLAGCAPAPARTTNATSPLSPLAAPAVKAGPLALTILHSNDTWGYVDACG